MKIHFNQVSGTILDVKVDKRNECFNFGSDNAYPSLIEALIIMSVTSKTCVDRVAKAIYGDSFGEVGKVIVNSKGQTLNEVLRIAAREYAKHNNCYLHVRYNAEFEVLSIIVIPVPEVRLGKADDRGYSGKYLIYDNWDKSKGKKIMTEKFIVVDRFNPNKKVIESQIRMKASKDGKPDNTSSIVDIIEQYNGQLIHIKKDSSYIYSLSDLHPVLSEALLESNSQTFRSKGAQKGFLNTKILGVQPFKDEDERREFVGRLKLVQGAEGSNSVVLMESTQPSDDLSKQMFIGDLSGAYNDKLFEYSDKQAEKDICKAFSVNIILIDPTDSGSLGDSGGKLEEAKNQLWESREEDRNQFEEVFSMLMKAFTDKDRIAENLTIKNPYVDDDEAKEAKNVNKQAQANLRGSVGGVTALTSLVSQVNKGEVPKESAVAIVKSIYGFTDTKAKEIIGGFEDEE